MKTMERKTAATDDDFLTTVARSIGSTLGHVAAKVNATTHPSRRRTRGTRAPANTFPHRTASGASPPQSRRGATK